MAGKGGEEKKQGMEKAAFPRRARLRRPNPWSLIPAPRRLCREALLLLLPWSPAEKRKFANIDAAKVSKHHYVQSPLRIPGAV